MENCKICKSSKNLRLERNISNTLYSNKTNDLRSIVRETNKK